MSNKNSNYPTTGLDRQLNGTEFTAQTTQSLMELSSMGKPKDTKELRERIEMFFEFCQSHSIRPGIEALAYALNTDRSNFWHWCQDGNGKGEEWVSLCKNARQAIVAFTEQAALCGHLSPPVAIFSLKNIGGWKDTISFEEMVPAIKEKTVLTADQLPSLANLNMNKPKGGGGDE